MAEEQKVFVPNGKIMVVNDAANFTTRLEYYPAFKSKNNSRRIADITMGSPTLFGGKKNHRYLTLTLYPSQFRGDEFAVFKEMLHVLLEEFDYAKLYATGKVNYLEINVDSLSHKQHSFIPYRRYCTKSNIWEEQDGHPGTTYIGSKNSDVFFRIYDKHKQLVDKHKPVIYGELPHTRLEVAMRRLKIPPVDLVHLENPFLKLGIADLEKAKALSTDPDWQDFLAQSLKVGVPAALGVHSKKRKTFMALLKSVQASWWNPQSIWEGLPAALASIAP